MSGCNHPLDISEREGCGYERNPRGQLPCAHRGFHHHLLVPSAVYVREGKPRTVCELRCSRIHFSKRESGRGEELGGFQGEASRPALLPYIHSFLAVIVRGNYPVILALSSSCLHFKSLLWKKRCTMKSIGFAYLLEIQLLGIFSGTVKCCTLQNNPLESPCGIPQRVTAPSLCPERTLPAHPSVPYGDFGLREIELYPPNK